MVGQSKSCSDCVRCIYRPPIHPLKERRGDSSRLRANVVQVKVVASNKASSWRPI